MVYIGNIERQRDAERQHEFRSAVGYGDIEPTVAESRGSEKSKTVDEFSEVEDFIRAVLIVG